MCPSEDEIWQYFTTCILPAVTKWQLQKDSVGSVMGEGGGPQAINTYLSSLLAHLEQEQVAMSEVQYVIQSCII